LFIVAPFFTGGNAHAQVFKSESDFKKYFTEHAASLSPVEGLWMVKTTQEFNSYDTLYDENTFSQTVAVVKQDTVFASYDMKGVPYNVFFSKTDVDQVYLYRIYLKEVDRFTKAEAVIGAGSTMQYVYEFPEDYLHVMFKQTFEKGERVVNKVKWNKTFPK